MEENEKREPSEPGVLVSEQEAQYIIARQRDEINHLRATLEVTLDRLVSHLGHLCRMAAMDCRSLSVDELIAKFEKEARGSV